jgi:hypothetical protein
MANREHPVLVTSFLAAEDLSTHQFKVMELSSGNVQRTNAITDVPIGVLQNDPASGGVADVMHDGVTRAVAGAAIAVGAKVACTAAGKVQTAATTQHVLGVALTAAAADGDIITVLLQMGGAPLP